MKVLFVGRSPLQSTGLGKTLLNVGRQLSARHQIVYAAARDANLHWAQGAEELLWAQFHPWTEPFAGQDPAASAESLLPAIQNVRPDVVLMLGDVWHFTALPTLRGALKGPQPRFVLWLTVDSRPFPMPYASIVDSADDVLTTTGWGARVLRGEIDPIEGVEPLRRPRWRADAIELGVDSALYCRQERPEVNPFGKGLVIGWCGLNQARKFPVHALFILRKLIEEHHATLVVKSSPDGQFDLGDWCDNLGLSWTRRGPADCPGRDVYLAEQPTPEAVMPAFYRNLDVLLMTCGSGAPDLVALEARACGVVTVAVNTSCYQGYTDLQVPPRGGGPGVPGGWLEEPDIPLTAKALGLFAKQKVDAGEVQAAGLAPVRDWSEVADEIQKRLLTPQPGWMRRATL